MDFQFFFQNYQNVKKYKAELLKYLLKYEKLCILNMKNVKI